MARRHQLDFFMKPERLAALLLETLDGWNGALVAERPSVAPLEYEMLELSRLPHYVTKERGKRFWLSLEGVPRDHYDLDYTYRTPGQHVSLSLGRVDPSRRYIHTNNAMVDARKKPALDLLAILREAVARVSRRGVITVLRSGKEEYLDDLYWTPDLRDWSLAGSRAADDDTAAKVPS